MNIFKRFMAMLLVMCMLIGMVPTNIHAAENDNTETTTTESTDASVYAQNSFMKVFHLDCGRKYFTVDQVKELIDEISSVGFNYMELAVGNDGLRLLLDDMSVTANGTTYASETVKSGIKAGNTNYSHSGEWTQSEMDTIIAYAKTKGIEIIPLVNNPGHMDSILAAMKACGIDGYYESSARTVDLENTKAVDFTQALVMKYAEYFAGKGCKYFNIGADEYANDYHSSDSTGMGFGYLIDNNKYGNFITYINELVTDLCDLGMTPIAFNDGIYFRENTSFGTFDNRLMIASWSGGWGGIKPASTTFLANKGHKILNTNERWYYVLGRKQSVNGTYCYESALSNAKSESVTTVTDHLDVTPIGAMQCVWCDEPSVDYETYKSNVKTLIHTLAENNTTYFTGPNETVEPEEPEVVTKTDEDTKIAVTAPGLTNLTIKEVTAPVIEDAATGKVQAWDINPITENGKYVGEAEVSVPVPSDWTNVRGGVLASDNGKEVMGIKGKLENAVFTFTVPHFSTVVAYEVEAADVEADVTVNLVVGQTSQTYTDNNGYFTSADGLDTSIATATLGGNEGSEATVKYTATTVTCRNLLNSNATYQATNYYVLADDGKYYPLYVTRTSQSGWFTTYYSYTYYYSTDNGASFKQYGTQNNLQSTNTNANINVYTKSGTEAVPAMTTVSFTGVSVGTTYATVGDTVYEIVVSRKTESVTLTVGDRKSYADNSTSTPVVADSSVVDAAIKNGTLTITAKAVGTTTVTTDNGEYTVTVVEFDPSTVTPLTVEYWITNIITRTVESTTSNPVTTQQITASTAGISTAEGVDINAMMPEWTIKRDDDSGDDREVEFWHVRLLDKSQTNNSTSGTEEQTTDSADDETTNGDAVTRVRYYNPDGNGHRWQMLSGTAWLDVTSNNQIVAYYMEVVDIKNANGTTELHVNAADWGKLGDGSPASSYADTSKYCSISLQIVYEDGSGNPATTTAADLDSKTLIFNYWDNGRGIGTFAFDTLGQFNIYQITAETGAVTVNFSGGAWGTAQVSNFTWDENEKVVWSGESETASIYNNTSHPTSEDPKDNLMWNENREAILIRVYVRAIKTEDSLNVVYFDEKFNDTLYSYNITVPVDANFNDDMIGTPIPFKDSSDRIDVSGCGIENAYGITQYFQTELTKVPEAKGKYNNELYEYTGSKISEDGKTLYLYYNINQQALSPNYVADFGLPITFPLSDVVKKNIETVKSVTVNEKTRYGTLSYNSSKEEFTYTPTVILPNIDVLTINILFDGASSVTTTNVGVTPATTVHYEESFINWDSNWTGGNSAITVGNQTTEVLGGKVNNFGYDSIYSNTTGASNGTNATATSIGAKGTFTFTGDGIQVFANCTEESGSVSVQVKNSAGQTVSMSIVNTVVDPGETGATSGQTGNLYGLPIVSLVDLQNMAHDTYTVTINKVLNDKPVYIDGIRVFNTMKDSSIFINDLEDDPDFYEMRDAVLHAIGVAEDTSVDYKTMYEQVYNNLMDASALITDESVTYGNSDTVQDLLDNGPKNELYLYAGQTLNFKVKTNRVMQLGMKAPQGVTEASISVDGGVTTKKQSVGSSVDMFYTIAEKIEDEKEYTVQIKNNGNTILSITELKICDDPNFTFVPFTVEDIKNIICGEIEETPVYADAILDIIVVDGTGNTLATTHLTANGIAGETATFTATDIQTAVSALELPENYVLEETSYKDVEVIYGESMEISFTAVEEIVEPEQPEEESIIVTIINTVKKVLGWIFGW